MKIIPIRHVLTAHLFGIFWGMVIPPWLLDYMVAMFFDHSLKKCLKNIFLTMAHRTFTHWQRHPDQKICVHEWWSVFWVWKRMSEFWITHFPVFVTWVGSSDIMGFPLSRDICHDVSGFLHWPRIWQIGNISCRQPLPLWTPRQGEIDWSSS